MPTASKRIQPTDSEYATIHAAWVENGRPAQLERMGAWGGCVYRILDTSANEPDFYQYASRGPTTFSETSAREKPLTKGWHLVNRDYWKQKLWTEPYAPGAGFKLRASMVGAPNDLEPTETV